jgi:hypothetical protein
METKRPLFYFLLEMWLLFSGCESTYVRRTYPDPIAAVFWGKNVKKMIAYDIDAPLIADTTLFDSAGNMIALRKNWLRERSSYDSMHFIVRKLSKGEQVSNFYITYAFDDDGALLQKWNEINSFRWDFSPADVSPKAKFSVRFEMDEDGWITKEKNGEDGTVTVFLYDSNHQLTGKETRSLGEEDLIEKWSYYYEDLHLSRAECYAQGDRIVQYFCSKIGLPDSATYKTGAKMRYKYEW